MADPITYQNPIGAMLPTDGKLQVAGEPPRSGDLRAANTQAADTSIFASAAQQPPSLSMVAGINNGGAFFAVAMPAPRPVALTAGEVSNSLTRAMTTVALDLSAVLAEVMRLMQLLKLADRAARKAEVASSVQLQLAAADKMVEAAKSQRDAAIMNGIGQMAGGLLSMAGGLNSIKSLQSVKLNQPEALQVQTARVQAVMGYATGLGEWIKGLSGIFGAQKNYEAAEAERDKMRMEAAIKLHDDRAADGRQGEEQMMEVIRSLLDVFMQMGNADHESYQQILRG